MAMKKTQKKPTRKLETNMNLSPDEAITAALDNEAAGDVIERLSGRHAELKYVFADVKLKDIELNPDNEIFRQIDDEEDIRLLAEDIQRNGLLHNLVLFPKNEGKEQKYVLLSGERRCKALDYLQRQGDAKWNNVQNCRIITTPLSDNEKKVLLYSANLQVRGGFGDEKIRRKAVAEFVHCLQQEPYNLTLTKAKAAVKEISTATASSIDKDLRIETALNVDLRTLQDEKFLLRSEAESYLRLTEDEQKIAAEKFLALRAVDDPALEKERENIRRKFRDALQAVTEARTPDEAAALLAEAVSAVDAETTQLAEQQKAAKTEGETPAADEEPARARNSESIARNAITKNLPDATKKIRRVLLRKGVKKNIATRSKQEREEAIRDLEQMIEAAGQLKALIESIED